MSDEPSLTDKLKECTRFGRNTEVQIILEGMLAELGNRAGLDIVYKKESFWRGTGERFAIVDEATNRKLVVCHTGDYSGARMVEAVPTTEIIAAIHAVEAVIPRKLDVQYWATLS